MELLKRWFSKKTQRSSVHDHKLDREKLEEDCEQLLAELESAKQQWQQAQNKLDHALDADQIDYAIYAYQAAEQRYNMLIRTMKGKCLDEGSLHDQDDRTNTKNDQER